MTDKRHSQLVLDWLQECDHLDWRSSSPGSNEFATKICSQTDLLNSIYVILENHSFHEQFLESICKQLFVFYNTKDVQLRKFVWCFVPTIIGIHLMYSIKASTRTQFNCTDILLLCVYNQEIINEDGSLVHRTFRIPQLNKSSIYHELKTSGIQMNPMDSQQRKLELIAKEPVISSFGPYTEQEQMNFANRMNVICALLKCYHDQLSGLPKSAYFAFCRMCNRTLMFNSETVIKDERLQNARLEKSETLNLNELMQRCQPRIQFTPNLYLQLLNCLYFCIYNGAVKEAKHALMEIHKRALAYLYSDVLLMTNAMLNSLEISPLQKLDDECMKISVALSPTTAGNISAAPSGPSKTAITNASFKPQKMPEDIPIVPTTGEELNVITEEHEEEKSNKDSEVSKHLNTSSHRNIFSAGKEKRKEKKEKNKHSKSSISSSKHVNVVDASAASMSTTLVDASTSIVTDHIPMNTLTVNTSPLDLDTKSMIKLGTSTGSMKSPNSASTGNIESTFDQMKLTNENGRAGSIPHPSSSSINGERSLIDTETGGGLVRSNLSSSASIENIVSSHSSSSQATSAAAAATTATSTHFPKIKQNS